jgi:ATP/maltotriose-dependent transcriptional regulator MalT
VASTPAIVVIEGEAGIGKSRLVRELVAAVSRERVVLLGHCQQLHEPLPLAPVLDALHPHGGRIDTGGLSPVVGCLRALIPEIADKLPPSPPPPTDQHEARHQIFRAAVELLGHLAPAVLVLEDLHWADAVTCDFVAFLATHQPPELAIVVTTRTDAGSGRMGEIFARAPAGPARVVRLAPLVLAEVAQLARNILSVDVPDATAQALLEVTGGMPFVIEEVLRTLLERLPAVEIPSHAEEIASLSVSTALRDVVGERLATLDAVAAEILGAAAVAGTEVEPELIAQVTERTAKEVANALSAAHAVGLLHDQDGRSRFRHVLAQQIVYDATPAPLRRWWHARVAEVLEERHDPTSSARIAHHYRRAGRPVDYVRHAEAAADQAVALGNETAAAELLRQASSEMASLPMADRVRVAVKLGRAAVDGLAHSEAAPVLTRVLEAWDLPPAARGELGLALGRLHRQEGFAAAGYEAIARAVVDLEERPGLQARALSVLAAPETVLGVPVSEHEARCEEAERAAARDGSPDVMLAVRIARASLLLEQGRPEAWQIIDDFRADETTQLYPREHARATLNWAQGAVHTGDVRRADELLSEGRLVAQRAGTLRLDEVFELVQAMVDFAAGRWEGLGERVHAMVLNPFGFGAASLDARLLHGAMLMSSGDATETISTLSNLVDDCERVGAVWPLIPARAALSRTLLSAGDAGQAWRQAAAAWDEAGRKELWGWGAEAVVCAVEAGVLLGRIAEAALLVTELESRLHDSTSPRAVASLRVAQSLVAEDAGRGADVERLLDAARTTADEAGLAYDAAQLTERLGAWRCRHGASGGPALLVDALAVYGRLAARRDVARVTRTMRQHDIPVPYPWRGGRRGHGNELSRREQEVARLATAGHTNKDIAAQLYLSTRTVESHMSNVLRKLGLRTRDELKAAPSS